jgi:hypothetical protein
MPNKFWRTRAPHNDGKPFTVRELRAALATIKDQDLPVYIDIHLTHKPVLTVSEYTSPERYVILRED